jgi:hypothetical protein
LSRFIYGSLEAKTDQNRENRKPIFFNTDRRSVFRLMKTDRFWFRFPAGLCQEIPFSKTAKYLGVTLDDKLSQMPYIKNKIKKAKPTLMAIRSVIGK